MDANQIEKNLYYGRSDVAEYTDQLNSVLSRLQERITSKQYTALLRKLRIDTGTFDEVSYLQAACEISVCYTIADMFPETFMYEPKLVAPKDVDCSFGVGGYVFNIEVKCPDFTKNNDLNKSDNFKLGAIGRLSDFYELAENLRNVFDPISNPSPEARPLELMQHMDTKLKDFLISGHGKFKDTTSKQEVNVLIVCCDDAMDMQKWVGYLYDHKGLFTKGSFHPIEEYRNVDVVILSNIYHRHYEYWRKKSLNNNWDLRHSFNLIFSNPFRNLCKEHAIKKLVEVFQNYSDELFKFRPSTGLDELRIPHFVVEVLGPRSVNCFQHST